MSKIQLGYDNDMILNTETQERIINILFSVLKKELPKEAQTYEGICDILEIAIHDIKNKQVML